EKNNKECFIFFTFLLVLTIVLPIWEKGHWVKWVGQNRTDAWDFFFIYFTKLGEEIVYAIILLFLLFRKYAYAAIVPLVGTLVGVLSWFLKDWFNQPRPLQYYKDLDALYNLNLIENFKTMTGYSSFPSGHTFSAFAIYTFLALTTKSKWINILSIILAIGVGISRVYLNQHFLEDIYFGSVLGVSLGIAMFYLAEFIAKKFPVMNKSYSKKV
ncbi:MAG: phosphatase PAP2 family protein, partial [Bacteroidota bacterium]